MTTELTAFLATLTGNITTSVVPIMIAVLGAVMLASIAIWGVYFVYNKVRGIFMARKSRK
jgi:type IV secretory pathway VirB2 component (pilin)